MPLRLVFYSPRLPELLTALEILTQAGVRTQLALTPPESLPPDLEALGFLGEDPTPLLALRPTLYHALASPEALGATLEQATQTLGATGVIPLLFAAPERGEYVVFRGLHTQLAPDTLWAVARKETDLAVALHQQAPHFALYDLSCLYLNAGLEATRARLRTIQADPEPAVIVLDGLTPQHTELLGRLLWEQKPRLLAGSVATECTLLAGWKAAGLLPELVTQTRPEPVKQLLVVSGTPLRHFEAQLTWARAQGFFCHTFREASRAAKVLDGALSVGHSAILYAGNPAPEPEELAHALHGILKQRPLSRLVVYGEATLQAIQRELEIEALEWVAPLAPEAPLCRIVGGRFANLELVVSATPPQEPSFLGRVRMGA